MITRRCAAGEPELCRWVHTARRKRHTWGPRRVGFFCYRAKVDGTSTTKISISVDAKKLKLARRAAKAEGISLSAFFAKGLDKQLEMHEYQRATDALIRSLGPKSLPTAADWEAFHLAMARPIKRRKNAA